MPFETSLPRPILGPSIVMMTKNFVVFSGTNMNEAQEVGKKAAGWRRENAGFPSLYSESADVVRKRTTDARPPVQCSVSSNGPLPPRTVSNAKFLMM